MSAGGGGRGGGGGAPPARPRTGVLIDTHCHLDQLADVDHVLAAAARAGVAHVVAVSEDPASMARALALQQAQPERVSAGLGLHPVWLTTHSGAEIDAALAWLAANLPTAALLGEVGLDHCWATTPAQQEAQLHLLLRQLELAAHCGKPAALHSRRCQRQTMECAMEWRRRCGGNVQLHWFTQSRKLVQRCNEAGVYVSVGPTVVRDPATQRVAAAIADDLLLLETDAPVAVLDRPGTPADAALVAAAVAQARGTTPERIAALTTANACRFLGRLPPE